MGVRWYILFLYSLSITCIKLNSINLYNVWTHIFPEFDAWRKKSVKHSPTSKIYFTRTRDGELAFPTRQGAPLIRVRSSPGPVHSLSRWPQLVIPIRVEWRPLESYLLHCTDWGLGTSNWSASKSSPGFSLGPGIRTV